MLDPLPFWEVSAEHQEQNLFINNLILFIIK